MPQLDLVWLAALTINKPDADTDNWHNLTINVGGYDVVDHDFALGRGGAVGLGRSQAGLAKTGEFPSNFESGLLTDSSIRVGIRGSNAWWPQHVFVFGRTVASFEPSRTIPLAWRGEAPWEKVSTDRSEGKLTVPVPLVRLGDSSSVIRSVLLLVQTRSGTDSRIRLEITAETNVVLDREIGDTPQDDLETGAANWHRLEATAPFTHGDLLSNTSSIRLSILGSDAWLPERVFLFGLGSPAGGVGEMVTLVSIPEWDRGPLSTDLDEGTPSFLLPLAL